MKEVPMLFSTPMVQAIMDGRKTQTRREINNVNYTHLGRHICEWPLSGFMGLKDGYAEFDLQTDVDDNHRHREKSKCLPGDLIWVRETWRKSVAPDGETHAFYFKADDSSNEPKWKPSIHMPKTAARIWLRVTGVRVERLKDISPGDACDEGIEYDNVDMEMLNGGELVADFVNYMWRDDPAYKDYHFPTYASCIDSYQSLWESINGPGSWDLNPWVWVYTFEVLSKTGKP